ncbi:phosphoribosyltransferase [Solwaraspora sp. WMMD406]|uniref:phosphoribosyltransferase n=1 Tax=Solwaraspora sp. WMMD406 TaxID=3016095 RepID=UPI002415BDA9|nr:phosphoribosyltransferase [Solwaraspora sp. WMMD406]MDG4764433.1 phosphoribosyltransferase [Solwaraspora sp. WMMD406]
MTSRTARRTFTHRRVLRLTADAYEQAVNLLAREVTNRIGTIEAVIGIANGGVPLSHSLAACLDARVLRVDARHNPTDTIYTQATGHVTLDLRPLTTVLGDTRLRGNVLLVDDICGTGATIDTLYPRLLPYLWAGSVVHTAVLCLNTGADYNPHLWIWDTDDWVHFPWEAPLPTATPVEDLAVPDTAQHR